MQGWRDCKICGFLIETTFIICSALCARRDAYWRSIGVQISITPAVVLDDVDESIEKIRRNGGIGVDGAIDQSKSNMGMLTPAERTLAETVASGSGVAIFEQV